MVTSTLIVSLVIDIVIKIFYVLTLQNTLKQVEPKNRKISPEQLWLLLIPVLTVFFGFVVVKNIAASLELELRDRGINDVKMPTYDIGIALYILGTVNLLYYLKYFGFISPFLSVILLFPAIAGFICFIVYWVKVYQYKEKLLQLPKRNTGDSLIF